MSRTEDLKRIREALSSAAHFVDDLRGGDIAVSKKEGGSPVTEADLGINAILKQMLHQSGEGWLSEETKDDKKRLENSRVWVVDPLDGTREFVKHIPEWCISIGLVEDGEAVAGGICNPDMDEFVVGAVDTGVWLNGEPVRVTGRESIEGAVILASRSEIRRGQWDEYKNANFEVRPMGSIAWKLALVATGQADATWSLAPKNEWDVAAGVALVEAAGGEVRLINGEKRKYNEENPWMPGLIATTPALLDDAPREVD